MKGDTPDKAIEARSYLYGSGQNGVAIGALAGTLYGVKENKNTYSRLYAYKNINGYNAYGYLGIEYDIGTDTFITRAPTPNLDSNDENIVNSQWLRAFVADVSRSGLVHTTGDETISGLKTFSERAIFTGTQANQFIANSISVGDESREEAINLIPWRIQDKNNAGFLGEEVYAYGDGRRTWLLNGRNRGNTGWITFLNATEYSDGTFKFSLLSSPPKNENSTATATTSWVMDWLNSYLPLSGGSLTNSLFVSAGLQSSGEIKNISFYSSDYTKGSEGSGKSVRYWLYDKNNAGVSRNALAGLTVGFGSDKNTYCSLNAFKNISGNSASSKIEIKYDSATDSFVTYAPDPVTDSNDASITTSAWVRALLQKAVGKIEPTLTPLIDWEAMKAENNGTDVRNLKNTTYGITAYGGDSGGTLGKGDIILKESYENFDAMLVEYTNDDAQWCYENIIPMWLFKRKMSIGGGSLLSIDQSIQWYVCGRNHPVTPSTTTRLEVLSQNCAIIEIYGITY